VDKETEKIVKAIYQTLSNGQALLDWSWVKREAESQLAGKSPNGSIGVSIQEGLKLTGRL